MSVTNMNDANMTHGLCSFTRAGTVHPLPIPLHLMEGAYNGHFARDTNQTSTMYRPRITELSAGGHSGTEFMHFGYGHVYHPCQTGT